MRINEIFYSLQGEGRYAGTPAVFVRFSGCNLKCPFCDTQHETYSEMTEDEIVEVVVGHPAKHVVFTGGEPSLQLTDSLVQKLKGHDRFVQVETNGTKELPASVDWVTCSPKEGGRVKLTSIDELKFLYHGDGTDMSYAETMVAKEYRLQPLDTGNEERNREVITETMNYILRNPKWKLSLQLHKILNIR